MIHIAGMATINEVVNSAKARALVEASSARATHTVFHYTAPGTAKRDFKGTWRECMDWIAASGDAVKYYMRAVR